MGVDPVVLGLAAVDGFHVSGMAKHERDLLTSAQVSEPVPGEDALDRHDEILADRCDRAEEDLGIAADVLIDQDVACLVGGYRDAWSGRADRPRSRVCVAGCRIASVLPPVNGVRDRSQPTPGGAGTEGGLDEYQSVPADGAPRRGLIQALGVMKQ